MCTLIIPSSELPCSPTSRVLCVIWLFLFFPNKSLAHLMSGFVPFQQSYRVVAPSKAKSSRIFLGGGKKAIWRGDGAGPRTQGAGHQGAGYFPAEWACCIMRSLTAHPSAHRHCPLLV